MEKINKAIKFATDAHNGKNRKGTNIPYILHPLEAAAIAASITEDEDVISAAILHDTVEDTDTTIEDIEREFGAHVAELVAHESENKREELPDADTWEIRKQETIEHFKNGATFESKIVMLGDKLSNMRAIYRDELKLGDKLWEKFNMKDKSRHEWYYCSLSEILEPDFKDFPAYQEYQELIEKVFGK